MRNLTRREKDLLETIQNLKASLKDLQAVTEIQGYSLRLLEGDETWKVGDELRSLISDCNGGISRLLGE